MIKNTPYRKIVIAGSDFAAGPHSLEACKTGKHFLVPKEYLVALPVA